VVSPSSPSAIVSSAGSSVRAVTTRSHAERSARHSARPSAPGLQSLRALLVPIVGDDAIAGGQQALRKGFAHATQPHDADATDCRLGWRVNDLSTTPWQPPAPSGNAVEMAAARLERNGCGANHICGQGMNGWSRATERLAKARPGLNLGRIGAWITSPECAPSSVPWNWAASLVPPPRRASRFPPSPATVTALETDLGAALFNRSTRRLHLTEVGTTLL